jgi:hypothetical protein
VPGVLGRFAAGARRLWARDAATCFLFGILLLTLTYGALSSAHYGQSWDDPEDAAFGKVAARAYLGSRGFLDSGDRRFYGPAYFMVAGVLSSALHELWPAVEAVDVRHFLNLLCFQLAVLALYGIARRILQPGPALLTALLFLFQPLLFGHAFINQKDIPLLAGFTGSIFLGLKFADSTRPVEEDAGAITPRRSGVIDGFRQGWRAASVGRRVALVLAVALGLAAAADLLFGGGFLAGAKSIVSAAYRGEAWGPINAAFSAIARDAFKTPLSAYLGKLSTVYDWVRVAGAYLVLAPAVLLALDMVGEEGLALRHTLPILAVAALVLGLTMSIRAVGLFAGALVTSAVVALAGRRALAPLLLYWLLSLTVCYLTWPFLWDAPLARFLQSARLTADFPRHFVLFEGMTMSSRALPWDYLPTLLSIQLTETVLILTALGLVGFVLAWRASREHRIVLSVAAAWFLVPLASSVVLGVGLYSNFRQVFFMLPPLFLVAGLGIELVWGWLRRPLWRTVLAAVVLLPSLLAIARLRPYEYIYYNALVGGVKGAESRFTHDYWCTSSRESMAFVNAVAPPGARVAVAEPYDVAAPFARSDLDLARTRIDPTAMYLLLCNNRGAFTLENLADFPVAFTVTRDGVVLGVVLRQPVVETSGLSSPAAGTG